MDKIEEFGKYLLLDHIADGGMASIRRARFLNKIVIIKMIKEAFSEDKSYKTMFIDEIKNTFTLMHPNIAQIYDYGERDNKLYCAMEFVDGKNLKEYFDKTKMHNMPFPVDIALHIITEVCAGLHYTHQYEDKFSGDKPNIIHRDISPQNIMISHDGNVKIIDFGIAKASTNYQSTTEVGTMKCNAAYAGPEYIKGQPLDHRYDQFSVATVLWELLTGQKLFAAEDTILTLKKVQKCEISAPSTHNKLVTQQLDKIILKALSEDPKDRYENIEMFARELNRELSRLYPGFNGSDLRYFAKYLFQNEIVKETEHYSELFEQTNQFKFIQETKQLELTTSVVPSKRKARKKTAATGKVPVPPPASVEKNGKYQTFKLAGNINKLQLFYSLTISLILGFVLGEQVLKEFLRSWLFGV